MPPMHFYKLHTGTQTLHLAHYDKEMSGHPLGHWVPLAESAGLRAPQPNCLWDPPTAAKAAGARWSPVTFISCLGLKWADLCFCLSHTTPTHKANFICYSNGMQTEVTLSYVLRSEANRSTKRVAMRPGHSDFSQISAPSEAGYHYNH
jgi:hypothetical protein